MKREFRNRAFLPVVIPLAILATLAVLIGGFALILLYNTHEAALALAVVVAAGILLTISLAASRDRLDPGRRGVVVVAGLVPVLIGIGYATGLFGNVDPALLNINREPETQAPEGVFINANSTDGFCLPPDGQPDGPCELVDTWEESVQEGDVWAFQFNNLQAVPHNVAVFAGDSAESERLSGPTGEIGTITGPDASTIYEIMPALEAGEYFFHCDVHPNMQGTLVVTAQGEGGSSE